MAKQMSPSLFRAEEFADVDKIPFSPVEADRAVWAGRQNASMPICVSILSRLCTSSDLKYCVSTMQSDRNG